TDPATKAALKTKLNVLEQHIQMKQGVVQHMQETHVKTLSEIDKLKNGAGQKFGEMGNGIQNTVKAVTSWVKNAWSTAVKDVVGWFVHLYEHSRVFQQMVDDITHWITNVQNF